MYIKNWTRVLTASRDLTLAMAVAALFEGNVCLAFAIPLSFIQLLRVGEIIGGHPVTVRALRWRLSSHILPARQQRSKAEGYLPGQNDYLPFFFECFITD